MTDKFYNRELVVTEDGSSSIYLPEFKEHYHSTHGAVQESRHVFMKMGWEEVKWKAHLNILEIGFGTGLNAWLVLEEVRKDPAASIVHYTSLEAFPVDLALTEKLNYWEHSDYGNREERKGNFMTLHEAGWNVATEIYPGYVLEKLKITLDDFVPELKYDLVFFDAFAPRVQPEMWTKEVFGKMYALMNQGGVLVTYCAKGEVRRNMVAAGLTVEKVPGPPGKREMLRAVK